jgi:DNA-binding NarL/FixJ family response regulator
MLTNLSDTSSINEALEFGAHDFIVKADTEISAVVDAIRAKLGLPK